jgi:pimeloyl-ACP methyl ester carboxylesterase
LNATYIAEVIAAFLALYLFGVAITVWAGARYCAWAARRYGDAGMAPAPDDLGVFSPSRMSRYMRLRGLMLEIGYQALAFMLRAAHEVRLLRAPRGDARGTPVLVVPGYVENAGTMWWLGRRLARSGFNVKLLEFPSTTCAIEQNVAYLGACIEQIRADSGARGVAVVAHSMGGVIARTLVLSRKDHGVSTLVAIGSPFRGTHLARLGARLRIGHCVGQIVPGSDFLRRYPPTVPCPVPTLSMVAVQENIVTPPWSAVIAGATIHVLGEPYGHEAPLFVREVAAEIERWLDANGTARGVSRPDSETAARSLQ